MQCMVSAIRPPTSQNIAQVLSFCLLLIAGFSKRRTPCSMQTQHIIVPPSVFVLLYCMYFQGYTEVWCEV